MARNGMPSHYFIPRGEIANVPWQKCEGYPLPIAPDVAGELPRYFGSKKYNAENDSGYIVHRNYQPRARHYDDSLAFGGYSGYNFLRRDCKPGAK